MAASFYTLMPTGRMDVDQIIIFIIALMYHEECTMGLSPSLPRSGSVQMIGGTSKRFWLPDQSDLMMGCFFLNRLGELVSEYSIIFVYVWPPNFIRHDYPFFLPFALAADDFFVFPSHCSHNIRGAIYSPSLPHPTSLFHRNPMEPRRTWCREHYVLLHF